MPNPIKSESGMPSLLQVCGTCRTTVYCSQACQARDWEDHKPRCSPPGPPPGPPLDHKAPPNTLAPRTSPAAGRTHPPLTADDVVPDWMERDNDHVRAAMRCLQSAQHRLRGASRCDPCQKHNKPVCFVSDKFKNCARCTAGGGTSKKCNYTLRRAGSE